MMAIGYLKYITSHYSAYESDINIVIDEIYLKRSSEYKGPLFYLFFYLYYTLADALFGQVSGKCPFGQVMF